MRERMARFMQGRYGNDQLNNFLLGLSLALIIIDLFARTHVMYFLGILCLVWSYVRMFSRRIGKRSAENRWYLSRTQGIRNFFAKKKRLRAMKKAYHLCKCPSCRQQIRVPKGKGQLEVTCPKCRCVFRTRS